MQNAVCPNGTANMPGSLLIDLTSIVERIGLDAAFDRPAPLEIDLGCGDGSFLMDYAALHPERNFLGVERLMGRLNKINRKGRRRGLANLRGVRIESGYFLEYLLPPGTASAIHVYFPDPWPKMKHRKNRFIGPRFPALARQALAPGGRVYLRTDHEDYFAQMIEVLQAAPFFQPVATPAELSEVLTDFERDFNAKGIQTNRAAYELCT
jgi:tRNA (guanine-N7-)-methyltransferase